MKSKRRNADEELQEERCLFMALKDMENTSRAKQKLNLDDAALTLKQRPKIVNGDSRENMILDDVVLAVPGNEVFKRKLDDLHGSGGGKR